MYPASFEYLAPTQLAEAVELLRQYGDDAKLLAGGQSLVPMMKLRVARPKVLIDIHRIAALNYIREEAGAIRLGAMTRHVQIEESSLIREKIPMLAEAAAQLAVHRFATGEPSAAVWLKLTRPVTTARSCWRSTGG
jgi:CO/xanthine dehydrogenase FAD-binding subunit